MEDSTKMTIEFLRARLLSERSVSRTARQRADELAERVVELEEQLKAVTLQRKKAEKAAAEVLAILDNQASDFSETFDSSSDKEGVLCESKDGNDSPKKEESSVTSRLRGNKAEESYGLELEGSPVPSRSLSWKSCTDVPNSLDSKYMDQARRRRNSFVSTGGSSPRRNLGKSCRQIKRREMRSGVNEVKDESILLDAQENGADIGSGDLSNSFKDGSQILEEGSKNKEEKVVLDGIVSSSVDDQIKVANGGLYVNEIGQDTDMERALEQNAQLIGQYEAEENAQREWEEKFGENNSCTPDSCEPGNRSDITEERDEIRAETAEPADTIPPNDQGAKSEPEDVCHCEDASIKTLPNGYVPTTDADIGCSLDQQCSSGSSRSMVVDGLPDAFTFPIQENPEANNKGKQTQEWSDNNFLLSSLHGYPEQYPLQTFSSSDIGGSLCKGEISRTQSESQSMMLCKSTNGLGSVLEALQHAKLSLKHELDQLPLSSQGGAMVKVTEASVSAIKTGDAMEMPVGCAGLFRVPTDLKFEVSPKANLLGPSSDSRLSLTRYYPDIGVGGVASDQYTTSSYFESDPRISTQKPYNDHYLDVGMGLPASTRYIYPSYVDLVPRMPSGSGDGVPRRHSSVGPGTLDGDQYSFYHDQIRPNMRR